LQLFDLFSEFLLQRFDHIGASFFLRQN